MCCGSARSGWGVTVNAQLPPGALRPAERAPPDLAGQAAQPRQSAQPGHRERPRLGTILSSKAKIRSADLSSALSRQRVAPYPLGTVLCANGWAQDRDIAAALAEQRGIGYVDLDAAPPDPALLNAADLDVYLRWGVVPWRRIGRVTTFAATDPETLGAALCRLAVRPDMACAVTCTRQHLEEAVSTAFREPLRARAANRCPEEASLRGISGLRRRIAVAMLSIAALVVLGGDAGILFALLILFVLNAATGGLRIAALFAGRGLPFESPPQGSGAISLAARRDLPMISVLVPLYREAGMIREIVTALSRLDYPRERLEVRLLLEESDEDTRRAVAEHPLPPWIRPLVVPDGRPRTKPRALNYALDFCQGDVIGILDAEDRPEPGQLRDVATTFLSAPPDIACVQCQLSYHNAAENWLSRCFQIEYSIWFDVLLRGFQALRLPIPLGGTSVYFRGSALRAAGGWDAYNVTEDADLGMRLARRGHRVAVLRSVTQEEANCVAWRWVRQRSRWLKGYLLTWMSHMRRPLCLWRELGPRGFFGLNLLFLGAAAAYLAIPLFWAAVIGWFMLGDALWQSALPDWAVIPVGVSLALGQAVMLGCAGLAMRRRGQLGLLWVVPTLPIYWTLGAAAAWKAVIELVLAPFWWDKTRHGTSRALRKVAVRQANVTGSDWKCRPFAQYSLLRKR